MVRMSVAVRGKLRMQRDGKRQRAGEGRGNDWEGGGEVPIFLPGSAQLGANVWTLLCAHWSIIVEKNTLDFWLKRRRQAEGPAT